MPFWVCAADAAGNRIVGAEERLEPGPAEVDYPTDPVGTIVETGDGRVIQQQASSDPRRRALLWHNLPTYRPQFVQLIGRLEGLRSRTRREQGLSPWIYLKDDVTGVLRLWDFQAGTATGATSTTLSDTTKNWAVNRYQNAVVEIASGLGAGQRRTVLSNTQTTLTLQEPWTTTPTGAGYRLAGSVNEWVRVRVHEVSKRPGSRGGLTYDTVRVLFSIADPAWTDLG